MSSDDNPKLPQDIVVEILKRLPVKSLLRFRCVCQSWRSTIDDPSFGDLHFNRSAPGTPNWHTVCLDWSDPVQKLCSVFSDESLTLPPQSQIEIPFGAPDSLYAIVGSCNGLICVAELHKICYAQTIHLWNLFTRKHKVVLLPGLEHQIGDLGFGFDARSNDYKIVKLPVDHPCSRVEIYSLRTDSWRRLECEAPPVHGGRPAVFFNGNLHWFFSKYDDQRRELVDRSIVSFDVAGEVFGGMALPEELCAGNFVLSLAVLNGLLALLVESLEGYVLHSVCSVWVMRGYGVPDSWTKLYNFKVYAGVSEFCGFARNGELLMVGGGVEPRERISWDPVTGQLEYLHLSRECDVVTVVESLVSPLGRNGSYSHTLWPQNDEQMK